MTDGFALKSWVISLVNKVSKKNGSSKYILGEETVVGTWVDGRPIYRKVYDYTENRGSAQIGESQATRLNIDGTDINALLEVKIYGIYAGHMWEECCPGYVGVNNYVYISIPNTYTHDGGTFYISLEYTKTSDKATITV